MEDETQLIITISCQSILYYSARLSDVIILCIIHILFKSRDTHNNNILLYKITKWVVVGDCILVGGSVFVMLLLGIVVLQSSLDGIFSQHYNTNKNDYM